MRGLYERVYSWIYTISNQFQTQENGKEIYKNAHVVKAFNFTNPYFS